MTLIVVGVLLSLVASWTDRSSAQDRGVSSGKVPPSGRRLIIRAARTADWEASLRDVEKVLYSAANELWKYFPQRSLSPILVEPKGGPIVLYRRGPDGEITVRLHTGRTYWAQYAFQFAHEFGHVLCNYCGDEHCNKWFEESICEMASLFALRGMAATWKTDPPYPNWKSYASALKDYAEQRMQETALPEDTTLAQWYRLHAAELHGNRYLRRQNRIVAGALLPLWEKHPQHWEAVSHLNAAAGNSRSFAEYLADWQKHCPHRHKAFVGQVAQQFGLVLPAESLPVRPMSAAAATNASR